MLKPGELDLSDVANFADDVPYEYFRMLRREAPVCWHAEKDGPGHWAVTRYDDLKFVSRNPMHLLVLARRLDAARHPRRSPRADARDHAEHGPAAARRSTAVWCRRASRRA